MSSPGSRALVRGRGARTRRGAARTRRGAILARSREQIPREHLPYYYVLCHSIHQCRARLPREVAPESREGGHPTARLLGEAAQRQIQPPRAHRDGGRGDTGVRGACRRQPWPRSCSWSPVAAALEPIGVTLKMGPSSTCSAALSSSWEQPAIAWRGRVRRYASSCRPVQRKGAGGR